MRSATRWSATAAPSFLDGTYSSLRVRCSPLTLSSSLPCRLWSHKNLNEETHARLQDFLGGTSMNSLGHLMYMGLRGYVTNPQGNVKLVTTENIDRLKGIPILFIAGAENTVYTPENTDVSFTSLSTAHGVQWYERQVFEDRGHLDCWMGATANKDVYPRVRRHIERVARGNFVI